MMKRLPQQQILALVQRVFARQIRRSHGPQLASQGGHRLVTHGMHHRRQGLLPRSELASLKALQGEVNWYNFEITALKWNWPWHPSFMMSPIILEGMRTTHTRKRGKRHESVEFPVWYSGTLYDAEPLPHAVLANEILEAEDYVRRAEQNVNAPYDWAPGGKLYEQLRRTTHLPTQILCEL